MGTLLKILWWKLNFMWSSCLLSALELPPRILAVSLWCQLLKCGRLGLEKKENRADFAIGLLSPFNIFMNSRILRGRPLLPLPHPKLNMMFWHMLRVGSVKESSGEVFRCRSSEIVLMVGVTVSPENRDWISLKDYTWGLQPFSSFWAASFIIIQLIN